MNNKFNYVWIVVLLLLAVSCGKNEQKLSNQPAVSSSDVNNLKSINVNNQKFLLKYKFEDGEKIRYKLTSYSTSEQTIKTDSLAKSTGDQTLTYFFDIEVLEIDPDNIAELSINISRIIFSGNIDGHKNYFDSKANITDKDKSNYGEFLSIIDSPFRIRVNSQGEIIEVTRIDKIIDKLSILRPEMKNMTSEQKSGITKNIIEGELKPRTQLLFRELTTDEVSKESSWQKSTPATLTVFKLENIINYKVADFVKAGNDNAVKLNADLSIKWTGDKKATNNGINYLFDDPKVSGGGMILFNIDKGKLIRSETTTNITMGVQINAKDSSQKMKKATRKDFSTNKNIVELL